MLKPRWHMFIILVSIFYPYTIMQKENLTANSKVIFLASKRNQSQSQSLISQLSQQNSYQHLLRFFQSLSSDLLDMSALHQAPLLKLKKYKEANYYGEFSEGHRQGKGIMLYHSGQRYDGDWNKDQRHGKGRQLFSSGCIYEGDYRLNKMQGLGKFTTPEGQTYEGQWKQNRKHGSGMWTDSNGSSYVGQWIDGQASGFGVFVEGTISRYEGTFINFVKDGKGIQKFLIGDLYQGSYRMGKFDGIGEYFWRDGSVYKGQFKEGLKHGNGVWNSIEDGFKFEGSFYMNKKEGFGLCAWKNGDSYKGNYHCNMKHGKGQMTFNDGKFYKGQWQQDKPQGKGILFDGYSLIHGIFKQGQLLQSIKYENSAEPIEDSRSEVSDIQDFLMSPQSKKAHAAKKNVFPRRRLLSQIQKDSEIKVLPLRQKKFSNPCVKTSPKYHHRPKRSLRFEQNSGQQNFQSLNSNSKIAERGKMFHSAYQMHLLFQKSSKYIGEDTQSTDFRLGSNRKVVNGMRITKGSPFSKKVK